MHPGAKQPQEQPAKVAPFAGGNKGVVRKMAAGHFYDGLQRWVFRLLVVAVAGWALTGCPSLSPRAESPPSLDNADALARQGDQMGAAHMYEALAGQNSGTDRNEYLFRAARAFLIARRPEEAARVLAELETAAQCATGCRKAPVGCRAGPGARSRPTGLAENQHAARAPNCT